MPKEKIIFLALSFLANVHSFEQDHLPMSITALESFPDLSVPCFFIANLESGLALHEKNSNYKMHTGGIRQLSSNINSLESISDIAYKLSSENLCKIYANKLDIHFFKLPMLQIGAIFKYRPTKDCTFIILLYGANSKDSLICDINALSQWLSQFYTFKITYKKYKFTDINVFYGKDSYLAPRVSEDHFILMSRNYPKTIERNISVIKNISAPIENNFIIGSITYKTFLFEKPIIKKITTTKKIKKGNIFKVIADSIKFLIYG
ncbi:MAG: hypothetical protein IJ481_01915 [Alphaproteobacteria bacterium]|nr:hypothetical protein [Alphaproteobacteria bacterium]